MVLEWRNAPVVRESMANTSVITPDEHRAWFQQIRSDHTCKWMIVSDDAGPIGVGYLVDIATDYSSARWGFYKVPGLPPGTGTRLCHETLTYAFEYMGLRAVVGDVRRTTASGQSLRYYLAEQAPDAVPFTAEDAPSTEPRAY